MRRTLLAVVASLAVLLPAGSPVQAASCNGASHQITLSSGGASPPSGTASTPITFSVVYADSAGCAPTAVTVTVTNVGTFALTTSGTNFTAGVTYTGTLAFGPGSYSYSFGATSGSGGGQKSATLTAVNPATVVIDQPTPAPAPVPVQPPPPAPPPPPVVDPPPEATEAATESPTATATPPPSRTPGPTLGAPSPEAGSPAGLPVAKPADIDLRSFLPMRNMPKQYLGLQIDAKLMGTLVAYLSATAAGLAFFAFLMRRRRDPEPALAVAAPEAVASVATPTAIAAPSTPRVTPLPPMRTLIPPVNPNLLSEDDEATGPLPNEAGVPRWLRPSLRAARQSRNPYRLRGWDD